MSACLVRSRNAEGATDVTDYRIVKARKLMQAQAAAALGIKQPNVSALLRNRGGPFSVGRLLEFLTALGRDVTVTVRPTRKAMGELEVVEG